MTCTWAWLLHIPVSLGWSRPAWSTPPPEPTYTFADRWCYLARLDQNLDLNHMLTSGNCNPPREFPKFLHQSHLQSHISHVPVGARPLPDLVCPLCPSLCMSWWILWPSPPHTLFLGMLLGAVAWTNPACSQSWYPWVLEDSMVMPEISKPVKIAVPQMCGSTILSCAG